MYIVSWADIGFYVIVATFESCVGVAASNVGWGRYVFNSAKLP